MGVARYCTSCNNCAPTIASTFTPITYIIHGSQVPVVELRSSTRRQQYKELDRFYEFTIISRYRLLEGNQSVGGCKVQCTFNTTIPVLFKETLNKQRVRKKQTRPAS